MLSFMTYSNHNCSLISSCYTQNAGTNSDSEMLWQQCYFQYLLGKHSNFKQIGYSFNKVTNC